MKICIYTIGNQENGFGHVMRSLTLAGQLQERGAEIVFVTPDGTPGLDRLRRSPFAVLGHTDDEWPDIVRAETLLIDVEHGPRREFLERVRLYYQNLVTVCGSGYRVDDPPAVDELSDLVVEQNPFGNAYAREAETLSGLDYIMVDPRYAEIEPDPHGPIVLSMGGADPYGVTQPIANALGAAGHYHLKIIVGPAAAEPDIRNGRPQIIRAPDSLLPYMDGASLLIGALGMTAYEAAAAGVPSLLTAWTADHERTARLFGERGMSNQYGLAANLRDAVITSLVGDVASLLKYESLWRGMSERGRAFCDGRGAARVADKIMQWEQW